MTTMTTLTKEQRREIHAKGTVAAKQLLQAASALEFAENRLTMERDEFGTVGANLEFFVGQVREKRTAYEEARKSYEAS